MTSRRQFLGRAGLAGAAALAPPPRAADATAPVPALARPAGTPAEVARDEAFWARVAAHYAVAPGFTNLEAGYFGQMAAPVLAAYQRHTERVNREGAYYARRGYEADLDAVRARVAGELGVAAAEIAFPRGATEALQCLIGGYNRLRPGDAVLYADLDYPSMQYAMNWLAERRGVRVVKLAIPEPATRANVVGAYADALAADPAVRLVLLTHVNNKTGLVLPVAEIAALCRARGAEPILDAAHAWGQVELRLPELGVDFAGLNLHKWIGAPVGVGLLYVRAGRLLDLDRMMADESQPADSIASRVHPGTANFAAYLSVPDALDFQAALGGPPHKAARLRYLRDRWVGAARATAGLDVLTPDEPGLVAGISSLRLHGRTSRADNQRVVAQLLERFSLFTVWRTGLARGDCVRVTPALYNAAADADRLAEALRQLAAEGPA